MDTKVKQLEARIRELDRILDYEKKHNIEAQKQIYKRDRRIKELTLEADEYRQKFKDVSVSVEDLENMLKIYKRKLEESVSVFANVAQIIAKILMANHFICITARNLHAKFPQVAKSPPEICG